MIYLKQSILQENGVAAEEIQEAATAILSLKEFKEHFLAHYSGEFFYVFPVETVPEHLRYCYAVPEIVAPV